VDYFYVWVTRRGSFLSSSTGRRAARLAKLRSRHVRTRFGEVVWRFAPWAAETARAFVFHPGQRLEDQRDGSLVVRLDVSGWLEIPWHLYQWGDAVVVLAPEGPRAMGEGHRRSDFEALP
jgi:hypothetical protein